MKNIIINFDNLSTATELYERIYIYKGGEILADLTYGFNIHEYNKDGVLISVSDCNFQLKSVDIDGELKRANKLNLNREDNFYMKNPDKKYTFDPDYVLYINADNFTSFESLGEKLSNVMEDEKCYHLAYKIGFKSGLIKKYYIERIEDATNYKLQNNEHVGGGYGNGRENAQIHRFESVFTKKSGIIRCWYEQETIENVKYIVTPRCYSRIEYSAEKIARDELRSKLEKIFSTHLTDYSIKEFLNTFEIKEK